nr:T cell receptor gamma chain [Mus musculus]prf//1301318B T cell receptor gamma MNG7 [Mus musculus]
MKNPGSQALLPLYLPWEANLADENPLLKVVIFLCLLTFGHGKLEQPEISISRPRDETAQISCKVFIESFRSVTIHWYRQKPNQGLEFLLYVLATPTHIFLDKEYKKMEASKNPSASTSILTIYSLEEEDEAIYYCSYGFHKVFAEGTKLIVIPSDKRLDADISPKPTIFLPSVAETNLHKTGTYLCLLEKFFPDVIRVYWKEKDGNTILDSQEGDTLKTNDTYMKFSWLTVPERAMGKEHRCIVKHENNKGGADQEIFFPSIKKVAVSTKPTTCWQDKNDVLQLQFTITSAYYTYLLLLLKSVIYLAIISFSLLRRTSVCGNEKKS